MVWWGGIQGSGVPLIKVRPGHNSNISSSSAQVPVTKRLSPSPVSPALLQQMLQGYDAERARYLVNGFTSGFTIGCLGLPLQADTNIINMKSAFEFPHVIDMKISKEIALHRILGPFDSPPIDPTFRISPVGVVPKKVPGEYRMIHNLSYPEGSSVNDYIPFELATVQYATVHDAIGFIQHAPTIIFMAKLDVESAFRIIPISPNDSPLLGFRWRDQFYMHAALPMGAASSSAIFETFSTALEWIGEKVLKVTKIVHVLDDFLLLASTKDKCQRDLQAFMMMCKRLGVPLAPGKTVGPCTCIQFLGIEIDSVSMEARLPLDKLTKCRALLRSFMGKEKVTLRELQSLVGVLSFACSVIRFARAFLRRMIDLTLGITKPYHHIRLTSQVKLDLGVWLQFLDTYNGKSFFIDNDFLTGDYLQLFTDASGGKGYGAVCGPEWFFGEWPVAWRTLNITVLELYPIFAAVEIWATSWENSSICFFTDNESLVSVLNKQSSKEPLVMGLLRKLILTCLRRNINFTARHVPGRSNTLADKLSRCQIEEFRRLAPWANLNPTVMPFDVCPAALRLV